MQALKGNFINLFSQSVSQSLNRIIDYLPAIVLRALKIHQGRAEISALLSSGGKKTDNKQYTR